MRKHTRILSALLLAIMTLSFLAPAAMALEADDADTSDAVTQDAAQIQPYAAPAEGDPSDVVTQTVEPQTTPEPPPLPLPTSKPATADAKCPPVNPSYSLYVSGKRIPVNPFYQGSTLMLPLRVLAESTGYTYEYRKGTINMYGGGKTYTLKIGRNKYPVGGKNVKYEYAPVLVNNYTYVPKLYLEQGLGMKVTVSSNGRVDVKLPALSKVLYINGKRMSGSAPFYSGKTLMMPLRLIAERLGCSYYYSNKARYSAFTKNGVETRVYWGKKTATQGDTTLKLDKAAKLKNNSLFVPKSFIERMFNAKVTVEKNGRINVVTGK